MSVRLRWLDFYREKDKIDLENEEVKGTMTYALAAVLILLAAYAHSKNEQAKFWKEMYLYNSRRMHEFAVFRDWNAPEHELAEFNELYDHNRPS